MIRTITINPPAATYKNTVSLNNLRAINFFFGANGAGKTTISRLISDPEKYINCTLTWDRNIQLKTFVYNRDFVDRNFNQTDPLKGIFTLGEDRIEIEKEIAEKNKQIEIQNIREEKIRICLEGNETESGKISELEKIEMDFARTCWKQKEIYDKFFEPAFSHHKVRNSKEKFKQVVLHEYKNNTEELLPIAALKDKSDIIFSNNTSIVSYLTELPYKSIVAQESNNILTQSIIGEQDVTIARLIEHLDNSDWVKQGIEHYKKSAPACPFCQQPTVEDFSKDLESFFSKAYVTDIRKIESLINNYEQSTNDLKRAIIENLESKNIYLNKVIFNTNYQLLSEKLKTNLNTLQIKLSEPSRKVTLEPILDSASQLNELIITANSKAESHNNTVNNIDNEKSVLTAQVWKYIVTQLTEEIDDYLTITEELNKAIKGMKEGRSRAKAEREKLLGQIEALEEQITSVQPTIIEINDLLSKFGFDSFKIGASNSDSNYKIIRHDGKDAGESLSEGEKTFVTFLYFYQLIKGAQAATGLSAERAVVFDDPISSLDSDILYIVSSLIKNVMTEVRSNRSNIKQLFILTHNTYFHKEVSFDQQRKSNSIRSDESFWLVKKTHHGSTVEYCETIPVRSAYELLWEDIKSENITSISFQNTLRRILENYFTMWGGMHKEQIYSLFDGREKVLCQSLFSWVNDGSHSLHEDLYINQGEQTNRAYLNIFKEIFRRTDQMGHYCMMLGDDTNQKTSASNL